jgi:hypothetical protein
VKYSNYLFAGSIPVWIVNFQAAALRRRDLPGAVAAFVQSRPGGGWSGRGLASNLRAVQCCAGFRLRDRIRRARHRARAVAVRRSSLAAIVRRRRRLACGQLFWRRDDHHRRHGVRIAAVLRADLPDRDGLEVGLEHQKKRLASANCTLVCLGVRS